MQVLIPRLVLCVLAVVAGAVFFVNPDDAEARKRGRRDYVETLSEGINRRSGNREVAFRIHAGKRNQGLKAEGMDRFGISEFPQFGGRAPRPSVIQPDLQERTGRRAARRGGYDDYYDDYAPDCSY